jgi:hypothetical protein
MPMNGEADNPSREGDFPQSATDSVANPIDVATKCKVVIAQPETTHLYVESPPGLLSKAKDIPDV